MHLCALPFARGQRPVKLARSHRGILTAWPSVKENSCGVGAATRPRGGVRGGGTSRKRLRRKNSNHQKRDSELPGYFGRINVSQQSAAPDHQVGCAGSSSRLRRISMKALAGAARAMPHIEAPAGQAATVVAMVLGQLQAKLNGLMARRLASGAEVAC